MNVVDYLDKIAEDFEKIAGVNFEELQDMFKFYSDLITNINNLQGSQASVNIFKTQLNVLFTEMRAKDCELKMKAKNKKFDRKKWNVADQIILKEKQQSNQTNRDMM